MRELNRLGITSAIDAGGGFQNYPEDYQVVEQLHKNGKLTVRIAYNLFPQKPKGELADFESWTGKSSGQWAGPIVTGLALAFVWVKCSACSWMTLTSRRAGSA